NPAPGDWLNWRRTDNAWGYSPLNQINRQNVNQLQLAWSWAMDDTGANEATPLVYDGIMYLPNPRGVIQALDAATGDLIWQYRPAAAKAAEGSDASRGIQRNIAIFGDKIFATTGDAHISGGRRCVDSGQLRSGNQPRLLGHCTGQALGPSGAWHRR